ncbi:MAG TPA: hypothetical protein VFP26_05125 [Gemmatimonadaceae bacterium]|jgi:hypothetical protein|nr:hypothetical protein [Gemmatimonadaceae bacterium]
MSRGKLVNIGALTIVLALAACTQEDSQQSSSSTMTERQKDSVIARSPIPGARAVQKSMNVADSASARVNRLQTADTSQ